MSNTKQNGSIIAIITMMFLYAMISFVTNLAAPIGVIWKGEFAGSNFIGMLGNFANFLAYLFMGIPAGKLLIRIGYKKTALTGIALGLIGVIVQFVSGTLSEGGATLAFTIYLLGAFVSGFCVCILNTVVNPMLNLIGGGGNRGNQLNLIGGTLNSLSGSLTPMLVGAIVGNIVTAETIKNGIDPVGTPLTTFSQVNPILYMAMGVFVLTFFILFFVPINDPEYGKANINTVFEHSALDSRHCKLGVIAIFFYVGIEVGIPGTLTNYLSDQSAKGGDIAGKAFVIATAVATTYWLLMLIGRFIAGFIANKISSKTMLTCTAAIAIVFLIIGMVFGKSTMIDMPVYADNAFKTVNVPIAACFFVLCGLCTSIMWASIFNLATEGLGKYNAQASGIFMVMVVGGGILPLVQNYIADHVSYLFSYIIPLLGLVYLLYYALIGSKNVNKEIPVK